MKIENGYLVVDPSEIKKFKKITGHSFVQLIGIDPFTKVGDCLLTMHGLYKEKIDEKWLKRGDFAERVVQRVYKRDGHIITTYKKEEVNYDNFQDNLWFGGLLDIELLEEKTLVEVKSKSMKDYDFIIKNPPLQEIYQGLYYGYLRDYGHITMEWVFFDKQTEEEIFNDLPVTTLQNLKKYSKTFAINRDSMKEKLDQARNVLIEFRETGKIHISNISDKVLNYLGFNRNDIMMNDLPF